MLRSTWEARVREGRHHLRHDLSAALSADQDWLALLLRRYWAIPSSNRPDGVHLVSFPPRVVHRWIRIARATRLSSRQGYEGNAMTQSSVVERGNQAADKNAIRPFRVSFSDAELADMRKRITATRWPERETGRGCNARRAARDDSEARALLGDRARLAQGRGETERATRISSPRSMGSTSISSTFVRSMRMRCRSSSPTAGPARSSSSSRSSSR